MKKIIAAGLISIMIGGTALADEFTFEPVEISKSPSSSQNAVKVKDEVNSVQKAISEINSANEERIQNAILELDSVQVDLRDKLMELKAQYEEIDAQYNKYKTERYNMKKIIRQAEKKINNIDRHKENIRKDMI